MEPDQTEIASALRYIMRHPKEAARVGEIARRDMEELFSEEAMGQLLEREFWRIEKIIKERVEKEL